MKTKNLNNKIYEEYQPGETICFKTEVKISISKKTLINKEDLKAYISKLLANYIKTINSD